MFQRLALTLAALSTAALSIGGFAAPVATGKPEEVGLSSARLEVLTNTIKKWVDTKQVPGASAMILRKGKLVYNITVGMRDSAKNAPLQEDSIFRWYSMTKPIVSVAAMSLVEEGKLALNDPISKYLPEFKEMKVATETYDATTGNQIYTTAPAKRQISVEDLMRHTSGITYGEPLNVSTQVRKLYKEAGIWSQKWVLADFTKALARIPLMYEPGSMWEYGHSTDVLGRVVEAASGKTLDVFLKERIFDPLEMTDTAFQVPQNKLERLAQPQPDPVTGKTPELLDVSQPATFFAGGHGLVGTMNDYLRFAQMLLEGGTLNGKRILGPRTVAYMASNHVHPGISTSGVFLPGPGYGFGLGFGVRLERGMSEWMGSEGDFYWGGYAGTYFWVDPKENLTVVFMTQEPARRAHYRTLVRNLVYQAITD